MGEILYKTFARRETHPARIAALARLYGLDAAAPYQCSFFEIGCGDGGNILPLAVRNPRSRFVGIDLSQRLIDKGRADSEALGLDNVEFHCADIASYEIAPESFDYVVCHGVYSWVSTEVQRAILDVAKRALRANGVALISYNTFPGWRQRSAVRDILRVGAAACGGSGDDCARYAGAMEFLKLVVSERSNPDDMFGAYLNEAYDRVRRSEPSYVIQEFLGSYNSPMLFRDFMEKASERGLQFLSEARVVMMSADDLSSQMQEVLASLGDNVVEREQALDICRNRSFRETLLCHAERSLVRGLKVDVFRELFFVANYVPVVRAGDGRTEEDLFQERTTFRELSTPPGECAKLLRVVSSFGIRGGRLAEIQDVASKELALSERETLSVVATLWRSGFVDALVEPLSRGLGGGSIGGGGGGGGIGGVGSDVTICPLVARQAARGDRATSVLHDSYELTILEREAIRLIEAGASVSAVATLLLGHGGRDEVARALESLSTRGLLLLA